MIDAAEASIATLSAIAENVGRTCVRPLTLMAVVAAIGYRKRSFHSTLLRAHTLEKRVANAIRLYFNMRLQDSYSDTINLKLDSRAMKGIAAMTLVFLPITGVASVFSTPFFQTDTEVRNIKLGKDFWIFWAFVIPLTFTVIMIYRLWYNWSSESTVVQKLLGQGLGGRFGSRKKVGSGWA